jgi:hypothetical protein
MNKQKTRDHQRSVLNKNGWKAVPALKKNGSFKWVWIKAGRSKAYSRKDAYKIAKNELGN